MTSNSRSGISGVVTNIPGTELFAPHGADFAVYQHSAGLNGVLGLTAGLGKAREFQKAVQFDELAVDGDLFTFHSGFLLCV